MERVPGAVRPGRAGRRWVGAGLGGWGGTPQTCWLALMPTPSRGVAVAPPQPHHTTVRTFDFFTKPCPEMPAPRRSYSNGGAFRRMAKRPRIGRPKRPDGADVFFLEWNLSQPSPPKWPTMTARLAETQLWQQNLASLIRSGLFSKAMTRQTNGLFTVVGVYADETYSAPLAKYADLRRATDAANVVNRLGQGTQGHQVERSRAVVTDGSEPRSAA